MKMTVQLLVFDVLCYADSSVIKKQNFCSSALCLDMLNLFFYML